MSYDPKTKKYPYPEDTGAHYLVVKKDDGTVFDRNYPYIDRSAKARFGHFLARFLLNIFVFPVATVRMGLKIEGRENLKKHADLLKNGAITCANHVHMWDYICVLKALRPHDPYLLAWDKNVRGENGKVIRMVRGIPIPVDHIGGSMAFIKAIGELFAEKGWLHIYSEGSMWEYYRPIRPFKKGTAYFACKYEKPVLPLAFSYRKPGWIRRHIFHQIALFTLHVGEPLMPDRALPKDRREDDLTKRCHRAVCRLAGIADGENLYEPIYKDSKKVEYY